MSTLDMAALNEWLKTRPQSVQDLAAEFPANTVFDIEGRKAFVLGWTENNMVILTPIDPSDDYDGAHREKFYVCAEHMRQPT